MRRKGFTLVELVIVMAIIGILSSMFIMSAAESQRSAQVTNIQNNMRNLSLAALAYYADNAGKDFVAAFPPNNRGRIELIDAVKGYMQNWDALPNKDYYHVVIDNKTTGNPWWAAYYIGDETANIKKKMEGRAKSLELIGCAGIEPGKLPKPTASPGYNTGQGFVCLLIRKDR